MAGKLAIVLSGGGAKGAFQVGVLEELVVHRKVRIDIFAGVSTGAIQALGGAQDDVPGLVDAWRALRSNRDVYRERPLGIVGGLLGASSLYDASPIRARIRVFANEARLKASGRKLLLGVVNLGTGAFRTIDESVLGIHDWVYASSAMPVYFQPLRTSDGGQWVDGGVRDVTPLDAAMEQNPRAVLVVTTSPMPPVAAPVRDYGSLVSIGLRAVGILQSEVVANDTGNAALINALIAARAAQAGALRDAGVKGPAAKAILAPLDDEISRYRFAPIMILSPDREYSDTLEFDPAKISAAIAAGRKAVSDAWDRLEAFLA